MLFIYLFIFLNTECYAKYFLKPICRWFKRDNNAIPPGYVLQPISSVYPEFNSTDHDEHTAAKNKWWSVFECLQQILQEGSKAHLSDLQRIHHFQMSGTKLISENHMIVWCLGPYSKELNAQQCYIR